MGGFFRSKGVRSAVGKLSLGGQVVKWGQYKTALQNPWSTVVLLRVCTLHEAGRYSFLLVRLNAVDFLSAS